MHLDLNSVFYRPHTFANTKTIELPTITEIGYVNPSTVINPLELTGTNETVLTEFRIEYKTARRVLRIRAQRIVNNY